MTFSAVSHSEHSIRMLQLHHERSFSAVSIGNSTHEDEWELLDSDHGDCDHDDSEYATDDMIQSPQPLQAQCSDEDMDEAQSLPRSDVATQNKLQSIQPSHQLDATTSTDCLLEEIKTGFPLKPTAARTEQVQTTNRSVHFRKHMIEAACNLKQALREEGSIESNLSVCSSAHHCSSLLKEIRMVAAPKRTRIQIKHARLAAASFSPPSLPPSLQDEIRQGCKLRKTSCSASPPASPSTKAVTSTTVEWIDSLRLQAKRSIKICAYATALHRLRAAFECAKAKLQPADPLRLTVAKELADYHITTLGQPEQGASIAIEAIESVHWAQTHPRPSGMCVNTARHSPREPLLSEIKAGVPLNPTPTLKVAAQRPRGDLLREICTGVPLRSTPVRKTRRDWLKQDAKQAMRIGFREQLMARSNQLRPTRTEVKRHPVVVDSTYAAQQEQSGQVMRWPVVKAPTVLNRSDLHMAWRAEKIRVEGLFRPGYAVEAEAHPVRKPRNFKLGDDVLHHSARDALLSAIRGARSFQPGLRPVLGDGYGRSAP